MGAIKVLYIIIIYYSAKKYDEEICYWPGWEVNMAKNCDKILPAPRTNQTAGFVGFHQLMT